MRPGAWPRVTRLRYMPAMPAMKMAPAWTRPMAFEAGESCASSSTGSNDSRGSTTTSSGATTADPWVEVGVEHVYEQVDDHIDQGDDEHAALDDGVIVSSGGADDGG